MPQVVSLHVHVPVLGHSGHALVKQIFGQQILQGGFLASKADKPGGKRGYRSEAGLWAASFGSAVSSAFGTPREKSHGCHTLAGRF
jgi:hypothetical protein